MKVGVTGTRNGMTEEQKKSFTELIKILKPTQFDHGSCRGVDVQAARLVDSLFPECVIRCHPSVKLENQEHSGVDDIILPAKGNFERNRDIVEDTDCLVACPMEDYQQTYGGTWFTFDYATKQHKLRIVLWPNGTMSKYED